MGKTSNMIQRIQSLFLLLSAATLFTTFFFPVAEFNGPDIHATFTNYGWVSDKNIILKSYPLYVGVAVISGLIVATVFMYKNRRRQVMLCRMNYLMLLIQFALYFFLPDAGSNALVKTGEVTQGMAFFLPLVSIGFIFMAERSIRKDEKMVRAADRLR